MDSNRMLRELEEIISRLFTSALNFLCSYRRACNLIIRDVTWGHLQCVLYPAAAKQPMTGFEPSCNILFGTGLVVELCNACTGDHFRVTLALYHSNEK